MGLLSDLDWESMRSDLDSIRADNAVEIVIRRGEGSLAPQTVRIANSFGVTGRNQGRAMQQSTGAVVVQGSITFDVQFEDRFTYNGILYQVQFVENNRRAGITATATLVI